VKRLIAVAASVSAAFAIAVPLVAGAAPPGQQKTLSIAAAPNPVVAARRTVLSGKLTGQKHAGKTVTLQGAPYPFTTFNNSIAKTTTDSSGHYSFGRRPRLHTQYRVKVGKLVSSTLTVHVRRRVSLYLSDSTPERGHKVRFSGRACAQGDGLVVSIQVRTSTGDWKTVRHTHLAAATRCSVYSKRLRVFHDHTFRVVVARDASHFRGISRRRVADVHG
jgi:hypothetical protein